MIHKSAIVHHTAKIGKNTRIGAFTIIGANVDIGQNCIVYNHVNIEGNTKIGDKCKIFPFSSIGTIPQDLKFSGEKSHLIIGNNVTIREHVTINTGTKGGGMITKISDNCLLMVGSHIAHDCKVGKNVIFANNATLAGHVEVHDDVIIGGLSAVHQFVRIGEGAMIGGMSGVVADIIPYGSVSGNRAKLIGLNLIGLKRRNVKKEDINLLRKLYKYLFLQNKTTFKKRINSVEKNYFESRCCIKLLDFLNNSSNRSYCMPDETL